MISFKKILFVLLLTSLNIFASPHVALQVLGSGGPESGDKRASSAYIVWIDGKSRILVDFGGGASLRFEEAGAKIEDLEVILLSHLHIDHTADLPVLLKSSFFVRRSKDLPLYGPSGNSIMPNTKDFTKRLFNNHQGAWQYMGDYLDGTASFQLEAHSILTTKVPKTIYRHGNIHIQAITVHHGPIPALAYRVNVAKKSITFSGDMNGDYHTLEKLAKGTDLLLAHNAVPKGASGVGANLHMTPLIIGKIAKKAKVKRVVLSHRMLRTLGKETQSKIEIRKHYKGSIKFANDLSFYKLQ